MREDFSGIVLVIPLQFGSARLKVISFLTVVKSLQILPKLIHLCVPLQEKVMFYVKRHFCETSLFLAILQETLISTS